MADADILLEVEKLAKTFRVGFFGRRVQALRGVSLQVRRGESLGYLGPNGSGKTTSIKCILTLIRPTQGQVRLFGLDPTDPLARARVGYLPESPYFYDYLKPTEVLDYVGRLYGLDRGTLRKRIPELLDRLGLSESMNRPLRGFSKGMLQRVGIAQSLLSDPDLLVWDEPMSGLDPIGRKEVRELMIDLRRQGKSLFFSSHVLADVETLCDSVCILDRGAVVAQGALSDLLHADRLESEAHFTLPIDPEPAVAALQRVAGVQLLDQSSTTVRLVLPTAQVSALTAAALSCGAQLTELSPRRDSLEELFVRKSVHLEEKSAAKEKP